MQTVQIWSPLMPHAYTILLQAQAGTTGPLITCSSGPSDAIARNPRAWNFFWSLCTTDEGVRLRLLAGAPWTYSQINRALAGTLDGLSAHEQMENLDREAFIKLVRDRRFLAHHDLVNFDSVLRRVAAARALQ